MSWLKKIIILFVIIVVIAIIAIMLILMNIKGEGTDVNQNTEFENMVTYKPDTKFKLVDSKNKYFAVESIINSYFSQLEGINGDKHIMFEVTDENELQKIKNEQFKEAYEVVVNLIDNNDNISKFKSEDLIKKEAQNFKTYSPQITKMMIQEKSANINIFIVNITVDNVEAIIGIKTDSLNSAYSIIPITYMYANSYDVNKILDTISDKDLVQNQYNKFNYINITNEYMARRYFNALKSEMIEKPENAYQLLDDEYAKKRFGSKENFVKYVENNKEKIEKMEIAKYKFSEETDYNQYVCIDKNDNYYIFKETSVMQYKAILDTYTVDLPEYIEKYNKSSEQQKVAYNIDKFIKAINDENYNLAYSYLAESFKENNFKTYGLFEQYAKNYFIGRTDIKFVEFEAQNDLKTYRVLLTNPDNVEDRLEKTFIIKLKEGTDFEMSFSIQ